MWQTDLQMLPHLLQRGKDWSRTHILIHVNHLTWSFSHLYGGVERNLMIACNIFLYLVYKDDTIMIDN